MHKNVCCNPSSEPSRRDGSDERSQHYGFNEKQEKLSHNYHQILPLISLNSVAGPWSGHILLFLLPLIQEGQLSLTG